LIQSRKRSGNGRAKRKSPGVLFIIGTDTGVGKTVFTASLLFHLRSRGVRALAMKPFCSGSRDDVTDLQALQPGELSDEEMNPFHFREPLAPLVAARRANRKDLELDRVVESIRRVASKCDALLIEGAGGLLTPLGPELSALDLISRLHCNVCVVAANRLGAINHSLLTVGALPRSIRRQTKVVLTQISPWCDLPARTNPALLEELLAPVPILTFPWLGPRASSRRSVEKHARRLNHLFKSMIASW
jgi:dethiobiotin synthetase